MVIQFPWIYLKLLCDFSHFYFILLYNYKILNCGKVFNVVFHCAFFLKENSALAVKIIHYFFKNIECKR